jgi:large repetitive protein
MLTAADADLSTVRRALTALALLCVLAAPAGAATHRIAAISITPAALPAGTVGSAYNQALTGNGGTGPYTFAVTAGSLPPGISLSGAGVLSGTPTSNGVYAFTVTSTDSLGASGSQGFSLSVSPQAVGISPGVVPPADLSYYYSVNLTGSGGTGPYNFAVTSGTLPAGIALDPTGELYGVPAAPGSYTFTVTATDAHSSTGSRTYTLDVNVASLDIFPWNLEDATAGVNYADYFDADGGTAPYTFSVASGSTLPPGLALASNGTITGKPSHVGAYTFSIKVTDSTGKTATRAYNFRVLVNPLTVTASLAAGAYAKPYDKVFSVSGGAGPYSFAVTSGTLPNGLTLSAGGELSGTPAQSGTFTFSVTATDTYGDTGTYPFTLFVDGAAITIAPPTLFQATPGVFYSTLLIANGGVGTYTFSVTSGTLPHGITLAADGTLSGTVDDVAGLYTFTVQAADVNGAVGARTMLLKVATPTILVTTLALPTGSVGTSYSFRLDSSGGTRPYTYSLTDGALPQGLQLSADGVLSGTPTAAGATLFSVQVKDAHGVTVTQSFRLVVEKPSAPVKTKPKKKKSVKKR